MTACQLRTWTTHNRASFQRTHTSSFAGARTRLSECLAGNCERPMMTTAALRIQGYLVYLNKLDSERRR